MRHRGPGNPGGAVTMVSVRLDMNTIPSVTTDDNAFVRPRILTPEDHGLALHAGGRGQITIAVRQDGSWKEYPVPVADLPYTVRQLAGVQDAYISQNRFIGRRRTIAHLAQLGALFADIDYYNTDYGHLTPAHLLPIVFEALRDARIPTPTFAVSTGRGMAIIWRHTAVPRHALPRWRACQRIIFDTLKPFGADPMATDAARVLRIVGSVNSKSGTAVEVITDLGHTWDFSDLADEILPLPRAELIALQVERAKRRAKRETSNVTPPVNFTAATLWEGRLTDLQKLIEGRWMGRLPDGQRDGWMFLASLAMTYLAPVPVLRREALTLAQQVGGWSEGEFRSRMSSVVNRAERAAQGHKIEYRGRLVDPRYRIADQTAVEWLGITELEMVDFNLRHFVSPEIKRQRERLRGEQRRRAAGAITRGEYEAGSLSRMKPWEVEGISRRTWERRRAKSGDDARCQAVPIVASPSGCMVAKPAHGEPFSHPAPSAPSPLPPPHVAVGRDETSSSRPPSPRRPLQLDLFGYSDAPPVNDDELRSWSAGVMPGSLQRAAVFHMHRLGVRHADMAAQVGLSRPQLTNVLHGRFGTTPVAADRLKSFIRNMAVAA